MEDSQTSVYERPTLVEPVLVDIDCPVCGGRRFKTVWEATPRQFLGDIRKGYYNLDALGISLDTRFCIKRCRGCSFVFVNPRFRSDLHDVVYNQAKVEQNREKGWAREECDLGYLYNTHHKWSAARILMRSISYLCDRFEKPRNENQRQIRLLDCGCGFGHLLDLCRVFEIEAVGVDVDTYRIKSCRDRGLNVCKPEDLSADNKFDIVVSTSVVEHINNLHEYFNYIKDRLEIGGYLHLIGLNPSIIGTERRKGVYRLVMPLEHINFFTAGSLDVITGKYGLRRIRSSHIFQPFTKPIDYLTPFLKNVVFGGFYPTGVFEADFIRF